MSGLTVSVGAGSGGIEGFPVQLSAGTATLGYFQYQAPSQPCVPHTDAPLFLLAAIVIGLVLANVRRLVR